MPSSGDIFILTKLAELASRCGISPTIADVFLVEGNRGRSDRFYQLSMVDGSHETAEELEKVEKVSALLGLDEDGNRRFLHLREVETAVDRALSMAPRARHR